MPFTFTFVNLSLTLRLKEDVADPFLLFRMRPCFEEAFRHTVCIGDENCRRCPTRNSDRCPFPLLFEQRLPNDPAAVKRHQKPSLPFAFRLPLLPPPPNVGVSFEIGLSLAGVAANAAADFVAALRVMEGMPVSLIGSASTDPSGCRIPIGLTDRGMEGMSVISLDDLLAVSTLPTDRLMLNLTTPLRLMEEGRVLHSFDSSRFLRSLLRRISSLALNYCGAPLEADYPMLSKMSSCFDVHGNFQYRDRNGDGRRFGGVIGQGLLQGEVGDFLPFFLLGEYFNVGKGASFGLGGYRLHCPPNESAMA